MDGLTGALCQAIAAKLMQDEGFQKELIGMVDKRNSNKWSSG